MVLKKQRIFGRRLAVMFLLLTVVACSQQGPSPTATPVVLTTTAVPRTQVPTFQRLETATLTPLPTEPLIIRDSLTGDSDSLYVRDKPSTMGTIVHEVGVNDTLKFSGRTDDNRWIQITLDDGSTGWLLSRAVTLPQNMAS